MENVLFLFSILKGLFFTILDLLVVHSLLIFLDSYRIPSCHLGRRKFLLRYLTYLIWTAFACMTVFFFALVDMKAVDLRMMMMMMMIKTDQLKYFGSSDREREEDSSEPLNMVIVHFQFVLSHLC